MHFFSGVLLFSSSSFKTSGNALQLLFAEFSMPFRRPCRPGTKTISLRLCLLMVSYLVHRKHSCFIDVTSSSGTACQTKSPLLNLIHQVPAAILLPFIFFIWSEISVYSGLKCRGYISGLLIIMVPRASWLPLFRNLCTLTFFFILLRATSAVSLSYFLGPC